MSVLSSPAPTGQSQPTVEAVADVYVRRDGKLVLESVSALVRVDGKRTVVDLPQIVAEAHRLPVHDGTRYGKEYRGLL
jgi:hypothetical protein